MIYEAKISKSGAVLDVAPAGCMLADGSGQTIVEIGEAGYIDYRAACVDAKNAGKGAPRRYVVAGTLSKTKAKKASKKTKRGKK